jgi:eukaryotic-like serine/threonine-protein kinase
MTVSCERIQGAMTIGVREAKTPALRGRMYRSRNRMAKELITPKLAGMQYRVVSELGTGAGSTILLIADKKTGKRYALKVVKRQDEEDDVFIAQAVHEYEVLQKLNHDTILKIYDCRQRRRLFKLSGVDLLMEYVEGRTIDELEAPEISQLVLIFHQVADGLVHMHRRGVFHGDLKPSNIMLTKTGSVKIIDFGTAWVRGQDKNRVQGTPQYMAPEQATEKVVDEKTDIYNFGATLYRMFTGHYANIGIPKTGDASAKNKLRPPVFFTPNLPPLLNELIIACLELSPDKRPESSFEVKSQLDKVIKQMGLKPTDLRGSSDEE